VSALVSSFVFSCLGVTSGIELINNNSVSQNQKKNITAKLSFVGLIAQLTLWKKIYIKNLALSAILFFTIFSATHVNIVLLE